MALLDIEVKNITNTTIDKKLQPLPSLIKHEIDNSPLIKKSCILYNTTTPSNPGFSKTTYTPAKIYWFPSTRKHLFPCKQTTDIT
jgi:hypothetical protein